MTAKDVQQQITINALPMVADFLMPVILAVAQQHPGLRFSYAASMENIPITRGKHALHFKGGVPPPVEGISQFDVGRLQFGLYGSSAYLARMGMVQDADDLARFGFVTQDRFRNRAPWERWLFSRIPNPRLEMVSDSESVHRLAVALGYCLGFLPISALLYFPDLVEVIAPEPEWTATLTLVVCNEALEDPVIAALVSGIHERLSRFLS